MTHPKISSLVKSMSITHHKVTSEKRLPDWSFQGFLVSERGENLETHASNVRIVAAREREGLPYLTIR